MMLFEINNKNMRLSELSEPISGAAGIAGVKLFIAGTLGVTLMAVIAMAMQHPTTKKEWLLCLLSTVLCSIFLGSFVVLHFGLDQLITRGLFGLSTLAGVLFISGAPGWFVIRGLFTYFESGKSLLEFITEIKNTIKN